MSAHQRISHCPRDGRSGSGRRDRSHFRGRLSLHVTAIIPAAGEGTRFGGPLPKPYVLLAGRPIIEHTLARFEQAERVDTVVLVVDADYQRQVAETIQPRFPKLRHVVVGGANRQTSVACGLAAIANAAGDTDIVCVHDGVRPFIRPALIDQCIVTAVSFGACIVARSVHETVKRSTADAVIAETVDRSSLWLAQTPQAFRVALLRRALQQADTDGVVGTDEAALVERLGIAVRLLPGDSDNIKMTTPEDLAIAEAIVRSGCP